MEEKKNEKANTKVQCQRGYVLNRFEKEVVLFLVFISFHDACLPLCTPSEISL